MAGLPMDLDSLNEWVGASASKNGEIMIERNNELIDIYLREAPYSREYTEYSGLIEPTLSEYKEWWW